MTALRTAGVAMLALASVTAVAIAAAEARSGGGRSIGSRGTQTYTTPPTTNTAPKPAAPIERSMTQPGQPSASAATARPAAGASAFGGLRGLLVGGLIGAGLMSLFGLGGSLAAVLGFIIQAVLIGGLIWLVVNFIRSRMQPAPAVARSGPASGPNLGPSPPVPGGPARVGTAAGSRAAAAAANGTLALGQADFAAFERLLGEIQDAYGREDQNALGDRTTPEMLSYFAHELADNAKAGVRNQLSGVKLLQGDLSEAWREPGGDYATVAMRYSIVDAMIDRASGQVVSGDRGAPQEVTEVWTFRRDAGKAAEGWELSAIQQV